MMRLLERRFGVQVPVQNVWLAAAEREFPSSAEEGWLRGSRKSCEATEARADGVVLVNNQTFS